MESEELKRITGNVTRTIKMVGTRFATWRKSLNANGRKKDPTYLLTYPGTEKTMKVVE